MKLNNLVCLEQEPDLNQIIMNIFLILQIDCAKKNVPGVYTNIQSYVSIRNEIMVSLLFSKELF